MSDGCIDKFIHTCEEIVIFFNNYANNEKFINNLCDNCATGNLAGFIQIDNAFAKVHNCISKLIYLGTVCYDNETIKNVAKISEKFSDAMNTAVAKKMRSIITKQCEGNDIHYLIRIICSKLAISKNYNEEKKFRKNIINYKKFININGKINLFANGEYTLFLKTNSDEVLRKKVYDHKFHGIEKNKSLVEIIQNKRHDLAIKNNKKCYAKYIMERNHYTDPEMVINSLYKLKTNYLNDTMKFCKELKKMYNSDPLMPWNTLFIASDYCKNFAIKNFHFPMNNTITNIINYFCRHYHYKSKSIIQPTWHKNVYTYEILHNDEVIALIFLDLFPRDGKYTHAMMQPLKTPSIHDDKSPTIIEIAITMNMPHNDSMDYDDMIVFTHELGHAFHHIVCTLKTNYYFANGINGLKRDEVEISSTYFESFALNDGFLSFVLNKNIKIDSHERDVLEYFRKIKKLNHIAIAMADLKLNLATKKLKYSEINNYYVNELAGYTQSHNMLTFLYHYENYASNYYAYLVGELRSPTTP
jgi:Zn-dependent oligopeptidase